MSIVSSLSAQTLTRNQKRLMHTIVLEAIDEYEMHSPIADNNARYNFIRLFESENTPIFCDLFNSPEYFKESNMPVNLYADWLLNQCSAVSVNIKEIKKSDIFYHEGDWYYVVTLAKGISYTDDNGILFPIEEARASDFMLQFTFKFDTSFSQCKITNITCLNNDDFNKLNHGYIVQKHYEGADAKRDTEITVHGEELVYNSFGQAYTERGKVDFWNGNIKVKTETITDEELYEYVQFKYIPKHLRLKLRAEMAINSAYAITGNQKFAKNKSYGYCVGLDLGVSATIGRIFSWGWFIGAGMSKTGLDFKTSPMNYSYSMSDAHGIQYNRIYDIESMSQGIEFTDIMVPLYTQLDFKLARGLSMIIELGAKAYYNMSENNQPFRVVADVSAQYANNTIITDGNEALGHINASFHEFIIPASFEREQFDISLMANFGFDINLLDNALFLELKGGYERGLKNAYTSKENVYDTNNNFPLVYSSELGKDVPLQPIANTISFKRQAIWANLGIMVKL